MSTLISSSSAQLLLDGLTCLRQDLDVVRESSVAVAQAGNGELADKKTLSALSTLLESYDAVLKATVSSSGFWSLSEKVVVRDTLREYAGLVGQTRKSVRAQISRLKASEVDGDKEIAAEMEKKETTLKFCNEELYGRADRFLIDRNEGKNVLLGLPVESPVSV